MQGDQHLNHDNNLAEQGYWDAAYADYNLVRLDADDKIRLWIEQFVPQSQTGRCIEVGCFPGRFITVFGDLGYELNGIDLTPRVVGEFPAWLKNMGYKTGFFQRVDFFEFRKEPLFDVVASFGFIEHFKNWEQVYQGHLDMVKPGGYLVIETPNFRGWFQRLIHLLLDYKNYKRHYVPSMNPERWAAIAEKQGFEILFSGYIGQFEFWIDEQPTSWVKKKLLNRLITNYERLKRMPAGRKSYSPYCGIIARKKS